MTPVGKCIAVKMSIEIDDLFTEKHKASIKKAVSEVKNIDQFHTTVVTPLFLLKEKEDKTRNFNQFEAYEVTVISDVKLIKSLVRKTLPHGITPSQDESDTIITESLIENIYEQYAEIISFQ